MDKKWDSGLSRSIDLSYGTNRAIVIVSIVGMASSFILSVSEKEQFLNACYGGLRLGALIFLSWAFAREIDPGHEISAFFVIPFAIGAQYWIGSPSLLCILAFILGARVLTRSKGIDIHNHERIALALVASICSYSTGAGVGIFIGLCLVLDAVMARKGFYALCIGTLCLIVAMAMEYGVVAYTESCLFAYLSYSIFVAFTLVFLFFVLLKGQKPVLHDVGAGAIDGRRIFSLQILFLSLFVFSLSGILTLSCAMICFLWALIAGTSLYNAAYAVIDLVQ